MQYFYDQQLRKYIQQFMRMFSGFCVEIGKTSVGEPIYKTVPVTYGDINRMAAHILKDNSENVLNSTPYISCYVNEFRMAPDRRRFPQFENKLQVVEKKFDRTTGEYLDEPGDRYQVIQHNPVPYDITMNVDIWTSNTDQKLQLIEQIAVIFNPSVNLRVNNNPIDWSSLTYVEMTSANWTSRTIPGGADDVIDISTFQFLIPILINPPAKVQKQTLIHTIINRMLTVKEEELNYFTLRDQFETQLQSYTIITPENYRVEFRNGIAKLLPRYTTASDPTPSWDSLIESYGDYRAGISQLRLRRTTDPTDPSEDVVGGFRLHETDDQLLYVDLNTDTVPANTLLPISRIIDPQLYSPGDSELPVAQLGQRYLLLNTIPDESIWGISASENSIIEYTNTGWQVSFDATLGSELEFVLDTSEDKQYEWNGSQWQDSYEGIYRAGFWRLYL